MLREFELLVASRGGQYRPPARLRRRIYPLPLAEDYTEVSATAVRDRVARGLAWEHLVPESIVPQVRAVYRRA
jgi:hypothetical protein